MLLLLLMLLMMMLLLLLVRGLPLGVPAGHGPLALAPRLDARQQGVQYAAASGAAFAAAGGAIVGGGAAADAAAVAVVVMLVVLVVGRGRGREAVVMGAAHRRWGSSARAGRDRSRGADPAHRGGTAAAGGVGAGARQGMRVMRVVRVRMVLVLVLVRVRVRVRVVGGVGCVHGRAGGHWGCWWWWPVGNLIGKFISSCQ